jgi:tetratricopeptide (TPR) repeat protein
MLLCLNHLAAAYILSGKASRALQLLEPLQERLLARYGPDHRATRSNQVTLGTAYGKAGRPDQALPLYQKAVQWLRANRGPDHPDVLRAMENLADLYKQTGREADALPVLEELLKIKQRKRGDDDPQMLPLLLKLANLCEAHGKATAAEVLWSRAAAASRKLYPDGDMVAQPLVHLGRNLVREKRYADAEAPLRECLAVYAKHPGNGSWPFHARSLLGGSLLGQKKYAEAEPLLLEGYEGLRPGMTKGPAVAARYETDALERLVQLYEATDQPARAAEWRKKWVLALYQSGATGVQQGHHAEAASFLRQAVRLAPTNPEHHVLLGVALIRGEKLAEAGDVLREAVRRFPAHAGMRFGLGNVHAQQGQWDAALEAYRRGVELDPGVSEAWGRYALLCLWLGKRKDYCRICREMLDRFGNTERPLTARGIVWTCSLSTEPVGDLERLLTLAGRLDGGDERHPEHSSCLRLKGLAGCRSGRFDEALRHLKLCSPDGAGPRTDATTLLLLALAHHGLKQDKEARAALEKARSLLATAMPDPKKGRPFGEDWRLWLHCRVLVREAEALLQKRS